MLRPDFIIDSITNVTVDFLIKNNIQALLVDVDNTLSVAHKNKTLKSGVKEWLEDIKKSGIKIIVLSNAKTKRAKEFANSIGLEGIGSAAKPLPFGYLKAVKTFGFKKKNTAIIGDQVFTDILGGKLAGIKTILTTNITPEKTLRFKIRRRVEKALKAGWGNEG